MSQQNVNNFWGSQFLPVVTSQPAPNAVPTSSTPQPPSLAANPNPVAQNATNTVPKTVTGLFGTFSSVA
jgi:hypothetical protein